MPSIKEEELKKEIEEINKKIEEHDKKMVNSTMSSNHGELLYVHSQLYNQRRVKIAELRGIQEGKKEERERIIEIVDEMPVVKRLKDNSQVPFKDENALVLTAFKLEIKKRIEEKNAKIEWLSA